MPVTANSFPNTAGTQNTAWTPAANGQTYENWPATMTKDQIDAYIHASSTGFSSSTIEYYRNHFKQAPFVDASTTIQSVRDIADILEQIQQHNKDANLLIVDEINKDVASSTNISTITNEHHDKWKGAEHPHNKATSTDYYVHNKKEQLITEVNNALTVKNVATDAVKELHKKVESTFTEIGVVKKINTTEQKQHINDVITTQETQIEQDKQTLVKRKGLDLYLDDDHDGVSNFDEIYIYHTDPEKYSTEGGLSDGEKILLGINPLATSTVVISATSTPNSATTTVVEAPKIQYESPTISTNVLPQTLVVSKVEVTEKAFVGKTEVAKKIAFSGKALPNSFVTLYIYSTPIIVTVKTDYDGNWTYKLDKELENGHHLMYVAMVNNSGKVIARSNPIPFVKQAAAVELDSGTVTAQAPQGFFRTYFIQLSIGVLVIALLIMLAILGIRRANESTEPPANV